LDDVQGLDIEALSIEGEKKEKKMILRGVKDKSIDKVEGIWEE